VAFQERFLRLGGERDMKRPARAGQPEHEQPQLQQCPGDHRVELAEVDFGLGSRQVRLRHADPDPVQAELGFAAGHIPGHRHLRQRGAVLGDQPLPDPPRGMPLLARHLPVGQQPAVNNRCVCVDRRPGPLRVALARRRHRRVQGLPHGPPVQMMPTGQLPDRGSLDPAVFLICSNSSTRDRATPRPPRRQHQRQDPKPGWRQNS
jgi:hypothetical protein